MAIQLADIIKGNAKKMGIVISVDGLELDDRIIELTHLENSLNRTVTKFASEMRSFVDADVADTAKLGALTELLEQNDELGDAIDSIVVMFEESMLLKSATKVEDMKKLKRKFATVVNRINKYIEATNK